MMKKRKIKFRIWDKINKEWLIYKKWPIGWQCPMDKPPKLIECYMYVSKDGSAFNELQFCIDSPNFEVMQYPGIKDCKGKDIFEGDICTQKFGTRSKELGTVTISPTQGVLVGLWPIWPHNVEIIGNIWEKKREEKD